MPNIQIPLQPSFVARRLSIGAFLLVLIGIATQTARYMIFSDPSDTPIDTFILLFGLDTEFNIPTIFSALLLVSASLLLLFIGLINKEKGKPYASKWRTLSFIFMFLALDEVIMLHERLIEPMRKLLGDRDLGIFYFAWVIPAIAVLFFLGLFFRRFLLHLHKRDRRRIIVAAAIYIGGAIGVELIGGNYAEAYGMDTWGFQMLAAAEESLEMVGIIVFIWALLKYYEEQCKDVIIHFCFNQSYQRL